MWEHKPRLDVDNGTYNEKNHTVAEPDRPIERLKLLNNAIGKILPFLDMRRLFHLNHSK